MGVDYFPCAQCEEVISDAGDYYICEQCNDSLCTECIFNGSTIEVCSTCHHVCSGIKHKCHCICRGQKNFHWKSNSKYLDCYNSACPCKGDRQKHLSECLCHCICSDCKCENCCNQLDMLVLCEDCVTLSHPKHSDLLQFVMKQAGYSDVHEVEEAYWKSIGKRSVCYKWKINNDLSFEINETTNPDSE